MVAGNLLAVFWRHILPNALSPVLAFATLQFGAILALSTLSFLGYGTPPPVPEWGLLIAEGRNYLSTAGGSPLSRDRGHCRGTGSQSYQPTTQ